MYVRVPSYLNPEILFAEVDEFDPDSDIAAEPIDVLCLIRVHKRMLPVHRIIGILKNKISSHMSVNYIKLNYWN